MSARQAMLDAAELLRREATRLPDSDPADMPHSNIVTESLCSAVTGYTVDALIGLRRAGHVTEGVEWFKSPTGRIEWDLQRFNEWRRSGQTSNYHQDYKSVSARESTYSIRVSSW